MKPIKGFEGHYEITDSGLVYSLKRKKKILMKPYVMKLGYLQGHLTKDGVSYHPLIHVLVAEHFLEPRPHQHEVNHKDGDKANNNVSNLEWTTKSQNVLHSYRVLGRKPCRQKTKPIIMMDLDNNIINEFIGINEAARQTKISAGNIHGAINGMYKTMNGFKFSYK